MLRNLLLFLGFTFLAGCSGSTNILTPSSDLPRVLAVESFLADIAQNVAGDRLTVASLLPLGTDPHAYQPAPRDILKVTACDVLILNGLGLESFAETLLQNAGHTPLLITASEGLTPLTDPTGEHTLGDPHFWMDPASVVTYVENIRAGLSAADPDGAPIYAENAAAYIAQLRELDAWISAQVALIPPGQRQLVTNHENLGYFAARYGFEVIGSIIPSFSSESAPSARQLAALIDHVRASQARAIFIETGANPDLAEQLAGETQTVLVTDLYTHSLSAPGGSADTYLTMMKYNVTRIVDALK